MRDGQTRIASSRGKRDAGAFLDAHRASIVSLSGADAGSEHVLEQACVSLGRGPGVDLAFDDTALSREHAVLEASERGFRIRDLGSTNGTRVNGSPVQSAELKHRDRFEIGEHVFQYVIEERESAPPTYVLPESE